MRILLDTHVVLWAVEDPTRLSPTAATYLQDSGNQLLCSAATIWELSIKVGIGKLKLSRSYRPWMEQAITDLGLIILPITVEYADRQAGLPVHHRDPFDRLLIAQALVDGLDIVSADGQLDAYGVVRLWQ